MFPVGRSASGLGDCGAAHLRSVLGDLTMFDFSSIFQAVMTGVSDLFVSKILQFIAGIFGGMSG